MSESLSVSWTACWAEFIAMALFVVFGCGTAMGLDNTPGAGDTSMNAGWVLLVALAFGLSIASLAYATGHHSGGHINCAVTWGLVLAGECGIAQGVANFAAQMLGATLGAAVLCSIYPEDKDHTHGLGSNGVGEGWNWYNAFVGEIVGTFLLMVVVLQTAVEKKSSGNRSQAALAIGFAVFMAHCVLIPIDGCSINPTRSFGPALVAQIRYGGTPFKDMWIFWLGPIIGASLAVASYKMGCRQKKGIESAGFDESDESDANC